MCKNEAAGEPSAQYKDDQRKAAAQDNAARQQQAQQWEQQQREAAYNTYSQNYVNTLTAAQRQALDAELAEGRGYASQRLNEMGLSDDPYGILSLYDQQVNSQYGNRQPQAVAAPDRGSLNYVAQGQKAFAPSTPSHEDYQVQTYYAPEKFVIDTPISTPDYGAMYNVDWNAIFDPIYQSQSQKIDSTRRQEATMGLNQALGNTSGQSLFPDTMDDDIIKSILDPQYASARQPLDRARSRGQISNPMFNHLISDIDKQRTDQTTRLNDVGMGFLNDYRGQVDNVIGDARNRAGSLDIRDTFDPQSEYAAITGKASELGGGLADLFKNYIGEGSLINSNFNLFANAGQAQGVPGEKQGGPLLNQFEKQERQMRTQGAF